MTFDPNFEPLEIIQAVENLLNIKVYLVGGAVRDHLLGKKIKDWDFTTDSLPEVIEEKVRSCGQRPFLLGKKFGTIGFKLPLELRSGKQFLPVEITTFRQEVYEKGNRKPVVEFVDKLAEDLNRRDFTFNALALRSDGRIVDLWQGKADLEAKILRAVGKPKERFREDPLRLLRAIRIATDLNFQIESQTWEYVQKMRWELLKISKERIVQEMDRILQSPQVGLGLDLLMDSQIIQVILPELSLQKNYDQNTLHHDFTLWEHTKRVVEFTPKEDLNLRWAALLHDIAKPFVRTQHPKRENQSQYLNHDLLGAQMAQKVCQYLKFSSARTDFIVETIQTHLKPNSPLKMYDDLGKKLQENEQKSS